LRSRSLVVLALILVAAAVPAVAVAHMRATPSQRKALIAAVVRQRQLSHAQAVCQITTISTANRSFASLTWPAKLSRACRRVAANGVIIEHHTKHGWRFVTVGSGFRCPIKGVPRAVARDFHVCT
jgi:hypothetical protein